MRAPSPSRLKRYLSVILRWCCITFVVFAITLYTGKVVTENLIPKVYTATAEIEFEHASVDLSGPTIRSYEDPTPESEIAIMESPDILMPIIQDLGLNKIKQGPHDKTGDVEALAQGLKELKLVNKDGTNVIDITVSNADPEVAAAIANAIADQYKARRDVEENQRNTRGINSLLDQIAQQQKVVGERMAELSKMKPDQSTAYLNAKRIADENQSLLAVLNFRLRQNIADSQLVQSSVRIISRAEVPEYPSSPDKFLCFCVTVLIAGLVSVAIGCFVEMILLFIRASEGEHS